MTAEAGTDLWRTTHYGFVHDSAHIRGLRVVGDVSVEAAVAGEYAAQYDQAGLALWADDRTWLKAGIEYVDGRHRVSCVVTRDFSDWSLVALSEEDAARPLGLRLRRRGDAVHVHWRPGGIGSADEGREHGYESGGWRLLRLAYLPPGDEMLVGPYSAAPQGPGFAARFRDLRVVADG